MITLTILSLLLTSSAVMEHVGMPTSCLADPSLFPTITKSNLAAYLEAFEAGGCSPIVMLPGIFGSRIMAEIDCETMQRESPEVFSTCGWNSCSRSFNQIERLLYGLKIPKKEYSLWIP